MATKSKLNGFVFKKLDEISNGLQIPTGNVIKSPSFPKRESPPKSIDTPIIRQVANKPEVIAQPHEPVYVPHVRQVVKQVSRSKIVAPLNKLEINSVAFTPMTNIVPTIKPNNVPTNRNVVVPSNTKIFKRLSRKAKQRVTHEDLNMAEYGALQTKQDKIVYLSMRGWSLKVEVRGNTLYHYATRYVNRQKKRLYLGSVNTEL